MLQGGDFNVLVRKRTWPYLVCVVHACFLQAVHELRAQLDAITAFVNGIVSQRLPQALYRKLSEAQVHFS